MKNNFYEWVYSNKDKMYTIVVPLKYGKYDVLGVYVENDLIGIGGDFTSPKFGPSIDRNEYSLKKPLLKLLIAAQRVLIKGIFNYTQG